MYYLSIPNAIHSFIAVISATSTPDKVGETPVLLLSHVLRGGYCPEDLDGQSIQSLAGELTGQDFPLRFVADPSNPKKVGIVWMHTYIKVFLVKI